MKRGLVISGSLGAVSLPPGLWWRVHSAHFEPDAFNVSKAGSARFSPLVDAGGASIPCLYLGATQSVALMETVLHDCPIPSAGFVLTLPMASDDHRRMASLETLRPLLVADFSALGLKRMGLKRSSVIDSDKTHYAATRDLAQRVYALRPDVQGIRWASRQDDGAASVMLFGSRIIPGTLAVRERDLQLTQGEVLDALVALLERLDAGLVIT